ncbi:MAG: hypothetical protein IKP65_02090 [Alphaproteobacteria bacterium]|nr:hypothetical protein [Alphaproteobacteria bacterium]
MTGNVTIDDFCGVCDEFNLEYYALDDDWVMRPKNLGFGELYGNLACYNSQTKTMRVSNGIVVINIQNNRTHEKMFSHLEYQGHNKYVNVDDAKKQIQKVLKNYKDIKIKLKKEEIDKDFK